MNSVRFSPSKGHLSVDGRKVIRDRHLKNTVSATGLGPEFANEPLFIRVLFKVLAFVFHNKNAAIGKHRHKVGIETASR
jgi:hypothetical protein